MTSERMPSKKFFVVVGLAVAVAILAWLGWGSLREGADDNEESAVAVAGTSAGAASEGKPRQAFAGPQAPRFGDRGAISGTVLGPDAKGIAGAQVCAVVRTDRLDSAMTEPSCVTAGADGFYSLEGLAPVRHRVSASAPTFVPGQYRDGDNASVWVPAGGHRKGIDVTLDAGGAKISGVVKDIGGGVVEGALVGAHPGWFGSRQRDGVAYAKTDAEGRFEVWAGEGSVQLSAEAEGYARGTQTAHAPGSSAEVFLTPESTISGHVIDAVTREPVAGVQVRGVKGERGWGFDDRTAVAFTDEAGAFHLSGLAPGRYKPDARADVGFGRVPESVYLGVGESTSGLVIELHPATYVEATLVVAGTDDVRCPEAWGRLVETETQREYQGRAAPEGVLRFDAVLAGTYKATASCKGYLAEEDYGEVEVTSVPVDDLVWELQKGQSIQGRVLDSAGAPVTDATVNALATTSDPHAQRTQSYFSPVGPDGSFEINGLIAGSYELSPRSPSHVDPPEGQSVELTDGGIEDVEIVMETGGEIRGTVLDAAGEPLGSVTVRAKGPGAGWGGVQTDDDGRFSIVGLMAGDFRVTASDSSWQTLRKPGTTDDDVQGESVSVKEDEVSEVELVVGVQDGSISGRVLDGEGSPLMDAYVTADRVSDSAAAAESANRSNARWAGFAGGDAPVITDAEGLFEVDGLGPGKYTLRAHQKGGGEGFVEDVEVGASAVEIQIGSTGRISGKVVLADGSSPDEFKMSIQDKETGYSREETFFRTGGTWTADELPAGTFDIRIDSSNAGGATKVELAESADKSGVKVELAAKVSVRGTIVGLESGEPISGLSVSVQAKDQVGFSIRLSGGEKKKITDEAGAFELRDVPVGKVQFVFIALDRTRTDYSVDFIPATIPNEDPYAMPPIRLVKQRLGRGETPGELGITFKDNEAGDEWDETPLVVAVVRPGSPAAAAGIVAGDVITTVDGNDVTGEHKTRYYKLTSVKPGTKLSVGRADKDTVEVVVGKPV